MTMMMGGSIDCTVQPVHACNNRGARKAHDTFDAVKKRYMPRLQLLHTR